MASTLPRDNAKIKRTENTHVAPHVAGKTWINIMKSFWGVKGNIQMRQLLMPYVSVGFGRHTEATEIDCIFEKIYGDQYWFDELSLSP
jgi:hypothetical protein